MRQGRRDRRASGGRFSREPARQEGESAGDGVGDRAQSESENRAGGREGGPLTAARVGRLTVDRSDSGNVVAPASRPRSRLQTRSGRRFVVAAALAAAVGIAFTVWIGFRIGGDQSVTDVDDLGEAIAALIAAASCGFASWRATGRMRLAWGLLAASALSWGIGETVWSVIEIGLGQGVPFPSAADAGFLPAIPLAVAGVLTFPSAPSRIATPAQAVPDRAPFWPAPFADRVTKEGPADLWQMSVPWLSLLGATVVALALAARGLGLDQFLTAVAGGLGVLLVASMVLLHRDSLSLLSVRDRVEQRLEQRTNLLNEVILHAPLGVVRIGPDYRVIDANPRMGTLLHAPEQIMVGSLVAEYLSPEEATRVIEQFKPLDTGVVDNVEGNSPARRADGSEVWLHWSVTAVRSRSGKLEYYLAMFEDITAKHDAEETAAANLASLERLNQLKSEFVSMVSHEFRTALVGIQGFSEILATELNSPEDVKSLAGDIFSDAQRLNRMINEMLDLDRSEAGKIRIRSKPVDLNSLVREVVDRAQASSEKHRLRAELDQALPIINADPDRLIQVISNLAST